MPSTPTTSLRLELQATGENISTWGTELNNGAIALIDSSIAGVTTKALTTSVTLTSVNYAADESRKAILVFTDGGLSGIPTVTIPAVSKRYLVHNKGATYNVIITAGGVSVTIRPGMVQDIYCDGTDVFIDDPTLDKIKTAAADFSVGSNKITSVKDPTSAQDAATKNYVDSTTATSVANAAASASAAAASASAAASSASSASTYASNSSSSAAASANSATNSANSATAAANSASSLSLPSIVGNGLNMLRVKSDASGYELRTPSQVAADVGITIVRSTRTSNTILAGADQGKLIEFTSGTFTQTFTAAATLGSAWFAYLYNSGTGDITLDPNGSETIDGLTTFIMYPGEARLVTCDGTAFHSVVLNPFSRTFTVSGTLTKPPGYNVFAGQLWGGGGGGAGSDGVTWSGGGGGGGACVPFHLGSSLFGTTETVTIGAGGSKGAAGATNNGSVGGTSSIGAIISAYGGAGGLAASTGSGGGGGALSAGSGSTGGSPEPQGTNNRTNPGFGGANGNTSTQGTSGSASAYGGASGGTQSTSGAGGVGGASLFGGAGGGGGSSDTTNAAGGTSKFGGSGGAGGGGSGTTAGAAGSAPAGGGGGCGKANAAGGDGARGELRIWGVC